VIVNIQQENRKLLQERQGIKRNQKVIKSMPLNGQICFVPVQFQVMMVLHIRGKELLDDQHSCAGGAGFQLVSFGGWGAQIRKEVHMAEKV